MKRIFLKILKIFGAMLSVTFIVLCLWLGFGLTNDARITTPNNLNLNVALPTHNTMGYVTFSSIAKSVEIENVGDYDEIKRGFAKTADYTYISPEKGSAKPNEKQHWLSYLSVGFFPFRLEG